MYKGYLEKVILTPHSVEKYKFYLCGFLIIKEIQNPFYSVDACCLLHWKIIISS